jgi:pimeloyl-ACP methyl ester carboxylesterase
MCAFVMIAMVINFLPAKWFPVSYLQAELDTPYDKYPDAKPPYYRVRYEASSIKGELIFGVNYTIWLPPGVKQIRGVVVHQHGCGEGSCRSGLTGAYDLHWQALAKAHDCALLSPAYEQPEKAECQMWCDPRNGSDRSFQKALKELGELSQHPELSTIPWALWGHSGGGHWCGGMVMMHPERVAAAWLRSGVPYLAEEPNRKSVKPHTLTDSALKVPMMCNLGTREGVTVKEGQFAGVWPGNKTFFETVRGKGGLVGVAIDPLSSHDCGNQRYLAIPWLDACLKARLPKKAGEPMREMEKETAWLAPMMAGISTPEKAFQDDKLKATWLPSETVAKKWEQYVKNTIVTDDTAPSAPSNVSLQGATLTWSAEADLESGLAKFIIERNGVEIATLPEKGKNPNGRPIFQGLQYSDTPAMPLIPMSFQDPKPEAKAKYRIIAVNTAGLKSKPSQEVGGE